MKMYILVRGSLPLGHQVNCAAHASLACYLKFREDQDMKDWLDYSYRKVTCVVTDREFEHAKIFDNYVVVREDALGYEDVAIAFAPREEYKPWFSNLRLFGQNRLRFWLYRVKKWLREKLDSWLVKDYATNVHENIPLDQEKGALDRCVKKVDIKRSGSSKCGSTTRGI